MNNINSKWFEDIQKKRVEAEVTKEPTQLHVLEPLFPIDATKLTKKQCSKTVESLMFWKGNIYGYIKGHT